MKCKKCKRKIAENSVFCNWCGARQIVESREMRVPTPKRKGNTWYAQVTVGDERYYISGNTEEEYYAKVRAAKADLIEIKKPPPNSHWERLLITILKITTKFSAQAR